MIFIVFHYNSVINTGIFGIKKSRLENFQPALQRVTV